MTDNLMGAAETRLPEDPAVAELDGGDTPAAVAARNPTSAMAWAVLSEEAMIGDHKIQAYAFARTGYHRSLDLLRKSGWKGAGAVPWAHKPNRGFLRCLAALARAAEAIGESEEHTRCVQMLREASPEAAASLGL